MGFAVYGLGLFCSFSWPLLVASFAGDLGLGRPAGGDAGGSYFVPAPLRGEITLPGPFFSPIEPSVVGHGYSPETKP